MFIGDARAILDAHNPEILDTDSEEVKANKKLRKFNTSTKRKGESDAGVGRMVVSRFPDEKRTITLIFVREQGRAICLTPSEFKFMLPKYLEGMEKTEETRGTIRQMLSFMKHSFTYPLTEEDRENAWHNFFFDYEFWKGYRRVTSHFPKDYVAYRIGSLQGNATAPLGFGKGQPIPESMPYEFGDVCFSKTETLFFTISPKDAYTKSIPMHRQVALMYKFEDMYKRDRFVKLYFISWHLVYDMPPLPGDSDLQFVLRVYHTILIYIEDASTIDHVLALLQKFLPRSDWHLVLPDIRDFCVGTASPKYITDNVFRRLRFIGYYVPMIIEYFTRSTRIRDVKNYQCTIGEINVVGNSPCLDSISPYHKWRYGSHLHFAEVHGVKCRTDLRDYDIAWTSDKTYIFGQYAELVKFKEAGGLSVTHDPFHHDITVYENKAFTTVMSETTLFSPVRVEKHCPAHVAAATQSRYTIPTRKDRLAKLLIGYPKEFFEAVLLVGKPRYSASALQEMKEYNLEAPIYQMSWEDHVWKGF